MHFFALNQSVSEGRLNELTEIAVPKGQNRFYKELIDKRSRICIIETMTGKAQSEKSIKRNLVAYSIGAGATLASVCPATASIVYSGSVSLTVSSGVNQDLDFGTFDGGGAGIRFSYLKDTGGNIGYTYYRQRVTGLNNNRFAPTSVASGTAINSSLSFSSGTSQLFTRLNDGYGYGPFSSNPGPAGVAQRGYLPIRLSSNGTTFNYGWVDYSPAQNGKSATILGYAYETTVGATIAAGAVPEPAESALALGILALGAAGLHRLRKQRQAAARA